MAIEGNRKNRVVWQDVVPAKTPPKAAAKKVKIILKIKTTLIALLKFPLYKEARKKLSKIPRKQLFFSGIICVVALAALASYLSFTQRASKPISTPQTTGATPSLTKGTPDYSTVLPVDKSIKDLGGWTRVSPPDRNPVFAYVDKIGNEMINVSEQPLPEDFKTDTAQQIDLLAQGFKANEKITVGTITVHIGTSEKGPQSIIFSKNNLLILVKSSVRIDNSQWAEYINSLQ